jgi:hypothetical protein
MNDLDLVPEEFKLGVKLESIFMPHTRRQRDEAHKRLLVTSNAQPGAVQLRCAHYTSAESALRMIESKRVWMRNTTCMSDYREVQHGFGIIKNFFAAKANKDAFVAVLDVCTPGAALEAFKLFDQWWQATQLDTYIACMSEHDSSEDRHGRLSMWRAFGGNTARVAIVFKIPRYSVGAGALNLIFSPVAYLTESEAHTEIHKATANINENLDFLRTVDRNVIVGTIFNMLVMDVVCLKHEGFREEREWRTIYAPHRWPSRLIESSTEVVSGIPQFVYKVPLDATVDPALKDLDFALVFDRVIIGPSPYPWVMYEAFVSALTKAGVSEPGKRVFASNIPIRN